MKEDLKEELREFGLLPEDLDDRSRGFYDYRDLSMLASRLYSNHNAPIDLVKKELGIIDEVMRLHNMGRQGIEGSEDYRCLESHIRKGLEELRQRRYEFSPVMPGQKEISMGIGNATPTLQRGLPDNMVCYFANLGNGKEILTYNFPRL